jgi:hypothetical protein
MLQFPTTVPFQHPVAGKVSIRSAVALTATYREHSMRRFLGDCRSSRFKNWDRMNEVDLLTF